MRLPIGLSRSTRLLALWGMLVAIGLLFVRFVWSTPVESSRFNPEKVNLALRRTAHHLLRRAGDSTSHIPAVEQTGPKRFRVQMGHSFDYDQLPAILQESFRLHKITDVYDVAVLDCAQGELQLGYSVNDLVSNQTVPCIGRSMVAGCYVIQVSFEPTVVMTKPAPVWPVLAITTLLVGLLFVFPFRKRQGLQVIPPVQAKIPTPELLHIGLSTLDVTNQILMTANAQPQTLTYREAKLLRFLANHPNQLLERNTILKHVWEDEGITVGRSVDVFVSRLRKLLQPDPSVRIVAVHGVGYRVEVQTPIDA